MVRRRGIFLGLTVVLGAVSLFSTVWFMAGVSASAPLETLKPLDGDARAGLLAALRAQEKAEMSGGAVDLHRAACRARRIARRIRPRTV